jgi:hypothetical protein
MNDNYTINEINSCRSKKKEYLKGKINELAMNSKNKNTGDLYIEEYMNLRWATNLEVT